MKVGPLPHVAENTLQKARIFLKHIFPIVSLYEPLPLSVALRSLLCVRKQRFLFGETYPTLCQLWPKDIAQGGRAPLWIPLWMGVDRLLKLLKIISESLGPELRGIYLGHFAKQESGK